MKTSDGKCCLAVTRDILTAPANPYTKIPVRVPGYSWATTLAMAQEAEACSDGNETPPCQKSPWYCGACNGPVRPNEYFSASVTRYALIAASPARKPVSFL